MAQFQARQISLERTRPLRHTVLRPHQTAGELAGQEGAGAFAVGAFGADADLVAVGIVHPDPARTGAWRVRGMAAVPHLRGRGAGAAVLDALLAHAASHGADVVWCNARTPARTLYERAGFRQVSDEFELPAIGPHVVMERALGPAGRKGPGGAGAGRA